MSYLTESAAYGALPHDLAAISAFHLGYFQEARKHGMDALRLDPYDQRLVGNMAWYEEAA
jgi:Flp pilus assembly protein TadD